MAITNLPFVQLNNLVHVGSFTVPSARQASGDPSIAVGATGCNFFTACESMAYNPANNSLFVTGNETDGYTIAEIAIPSALYSGTDATQLPVASIIQNFRRFDPAMGRAKDMPSWGADLPIQGIESTLLGGLMLHNGRLIGSLSVYYDASAAARKSHFYFDSLNLATANCSAMCLVKVSTAFNTTGDVYIQDIGEGPEPHHAGNVGLYMQPLPTEWRAELGNVPAFCGSTGLSIVGRTSAGPNAHGFDPDLLSPSTPTRSKLYQQYNINGPHWGYDTDDPFYAGVGGVCLDWGGSPSDPNPAKRKRYLSAGNYTGAFLPIPGTRTVLETNAGGSPNDWLIYGGTRVSDGHLIAVGLPAGHPFLNAEMTDTIDGRHGSGNYPVPRHPTDPWGTLPQLTRWERRIRLWDAQNFATVYNGSSVNQDAARPYAIGDWVTPVQRPVETSARGVGGGAVDPVNKLIYLSAPYDNPVTIFSQFPVIHVYDYSSALSGGGGGVKGSDIDRVRLGVIR